MSKKKTRNVKNRYKILNMVFGTLLAIFVCIVIYCGLNMKTAEERKVLDMKEYFIAQILDNWCMNVENEKNNLCIIESTGLSEDNDLYVKFKHQIYDPETHQLIDTKYHTLYFPYRPDSPNHYAQSLGD